MFNFFKKKSFKSDKLSEIENAFISTIINKLSFQYPLFKEELELITFIGINPNPGGSKGSFIYTLNTNSWEKICNSLIDNYDLKNIEFKSYNGKKIIADLYVSEGLVIGYHISDEINNIDLGTINIDNVWEKHFINKDYSEIENIINSLADVEIKKLNLVKNSFKILLNNKQYYALHDIGDGNYIVIDKLGTVFKITHDPFEVKVISNTLKEVLKNDTFTSN